MEKREDVFHDVSVIKAISIQLTLKTVALIKEMKPLCDMEWISK